MRTRILAACTVIVLTGVALDAPPASAQTCSFGITDMDFGSSIDTLSGGAVGTTATLTYSCSGGAGSERVLICAHLGEGSVSPGSGGYRRMGGGSSYLSYELYQSGDYAVVWGSAASADPPPPIVLTLDGSGSGSGDRPIFGRVLGGQSSAEATTYLSSFSGSDVEIRYRVTEDNNCSSLTGTASAPVSFDVRAGVMKNCLVSTEPVSFGSHGSLLGNIDETGAVLVTCTPATSYAIRLSGGRAEGTPTTRRMSKGLESITYGLYRNSGRDEPWGDVQGTTVAGTGSGSSQPHIVYGRVPQQKTPSAGVYTDTVVVTVDY